MAQWMMVALGKLEDLAGSLGPMWRKGGLIPARWPLAQYMLWHIFCFSL